MVRAQMLSELEEIINYKQFADQPDRQATMRKTWMKRFVPRHKPTFFCDALHSGYKDAKEMWRFGSESCKSEPWC